MKSLPVLVGYPFAPIGRGEDIRTSFRCFQRAGHGAVLYNLSAPGYHSDLDLNREFATCLVRGLSPKLNLYYLNGDEIEKYLDQSAGLLPVGAVNIICPQWELGVYPAEWSEQLNRFSEVWAPSFFVYQSLQCATSKPVFHLPLSVHIEFSSFLGRRHFRLPESACLFLFCFDLRSYIARKNPLAVLKAFEHVYDARSEKDIRLVIKLQGQESSTQASIGLKQFLTRVESSIARERIIVIDNVFTDNEIKNLVRCCDCFVSLHRSEGFGRGMAEAMLLGKPVVATGYSGNLEFMNDRNSCLVRYRLIEVGEDNYPHGENQVWADPDIEHAVSHMLRLVDDRNYGRALGRTASQDMRTHFSNRAIGLRYKRRIDEILRMNSNSEPRRNISWTQSEKQSSTMKAGNETHGVRYE